MCTAGIDCKFCELTEKWKCPRVARAFPTEDEEKAAAVGNPNIASRKRNQEARGSKPPGTCNKRGCMKPRKAHSSWCAEHDREYHRAWRADHPATNENENKRQRLKIHALKKNDPKAYRALLDRKNALKRARYAKRDSK